jgi:hypothetical protein
MIRPSETCSRSLRTCFGRYSLEPGLSYSRAVYECPVIYRTGRFPHRLRYQPEHQRGDKGIKATTPGLCATLSLITPSSWVGFQGQQGRFSHDPAMIQPERLSLSMELLRTYDQSVQRLHTHGDVTPVRTCEDVQNGAVLVGGP